MQKLISILLSALFLLVSPMLFAAEIAKEPPLAFTFDDPQLKWSPCQPFLPEGCAIAVLHGDPSKPNVDVFFKVPSGSIIPSHTHISPERMVLVSGELEVTYEGQAPRTLKVGSYAYGPAKHAHKATCAKGAPCVLFIAFESPLDAIPTKAPSK
ncbi:MAG: cupin domain-containing protein [Candidatus Nitrotoga sp.]